MRNEDRLLPELGNGTPDHTANEVPKKTQSEARKP